MNNPYPDFVPGMTYNTDNSKYWIRYVYDLTYYILMITIFLNIIFGIIIDAFASMR